MKESEIRKRLERKIKKPINETVWSILVVFGLIEDIELLELDQDFDYLVEMYREVEKRILAGIDKKDQKDKPKEIDSSVPADNRMVVLSHVLADMVGQLTMVRQFREEVLRGKLLSPKEVEGWIKETHKKDGPPTVFARGPVTMSAGKGGRLEFTLTFTEDSLDNGEVEIFLEYLEYPSLQGNLKKIAVNTDGVLGRLKKLVDTVSPAEWREHETVMFVLAGVTPIIPRIRRSYAVRPNMGPCWVNMTFDIRLSPSEVARFYAESRKKILKGHDKPLSPKHEQLALFGVTKMGNNTWEELMSMWNKEHPEWTYSNRRNFARDVKTAIDRITGVDKIDFISLGRLERRGIKKQIK